MEWRADSPVSGSDFDLNSIDLPSSGNGYAVKSTNILSLSLFAAIACAPAEDAREGGLGRDGRPLSGEAPACDHDVCDEGGPLLPECSECAAAVCAVDLYCCEFAWDAICVQESEQICNSSCDVVCEHDFCDAGAALDAACDPCVTSICNADPFCCNNTWDSICVAEVSTVCGLSCIPPPPPCAHDVCEPGDPLDAACDPCATSVCNADPYCCTDQWDRVCVREVDTVCAQSCSPPEGDLIDILFIVDNSASMFEEQDQLATEGPALFGYLASQGFDWRIAVTTTDVDAGGQQGAFVGNPAIIVPSTPNPEQAFANNVSVGINGSALEQGLEASFLALTTNPGFPRAGAELLVVYFSDEEDQSPNPVEFYESFLLGLPGTQANGIIGTSTGTPSCFSDAGLRYLQVVSATGGTAVSICASDWSAALTGF